MPRYELGRLPALQKTSTEQCLVRRAESHAPRSRVARSLTMGGRSTKPVSRFRGGSLDLGAPETAPPPSTSSPTKLRVCHLSVTAALSLNVLQRSAPTISPAARTFSVLVLGDHGAGKTALANAVRVSTLSARTYPTVAWQTFYRQRGPTLRYASSLELAISFMCAVRLVDAGLDLRIVRRRRFVLRLPSSVGRRRSRWLCEDILQYDNPRAAHSSSRSGRGAARPLLEGRSCYCRSVAPQTR